MLIRVMKGILPNWMMAQNWVFHEENWMTSGRLLNISQENNEIRFRLPITDYIPTGKTNTTLVPGLGLPGEDSKKLMAVLMENFLPRSSSLFRVISMPRCKCFSCFVEYVSERFMPIPLSSIMTVMDFSSCICLDWTRSLRPVHWVNLRKYLSIQPSSGSINRRL